MLALRGVRAIVAVAFLFATAQASASAAPSSCVAAAEGCTAGFAEDESDAVAALQIARHAAALSVSLGHGAKQAEQPVTRGAPRWRDAIKAEDEYFRRHASLLQSAEFESNGAEYHTAHDWNKPAIPWGKPRYEKPPNVFKPKRRVHVQNVQDPPQPAPFGPYAHRPLDPYDAPSQKLKTPVEVESSNGVLVTTLVVSSAWLEVPGTGIRILTRLFNGSYPGPTLRVRRGDLVNITVVNELGKQRLPCNKWLRREGQATNEFPSGLPEDHPRYQDVGQSRRDPFNMKPKTNNMHDINVTNLHVHGWHVSPLAPQDNVLDTKINPGESYSYSYQLSPYHSSGNSWYHSHWHGSVTPHTNGGMVGALIIEDESGESPDWIRKAKETLVVIHEADWSYFGPNWLKFFPRDLGEQGCFPFGSTFTVQCALGHRSGLMANLSGDSLYRMEYQEGFGYEDNEKVPVTSMFTVNGQYRPTFKLKAGEWRRLRLIFASGNLPMNLIFNESAPCQMWLIAKDSAWIERYPRKLQRGVFMGAGNRAQVMIRCKRPGLYALHNNVTSYAFSAVDPNQTFMYVRVTGSPVPKWKRPEKFNAVRPRYLQSLVDVPTASLADPVVAEARNQYNNQPLETPEPLLVGKTISSVLGYDFPGGSPGLEAIPSTAYMHQPVRFAVNNMTFSHDKPQASFPVGEVVEIEASGLDTHSWHMHTNPVQYVHFDEEAYKELWGGFYEVGDWQDVLQLSGPSYDVRRASAKATVRFQTDCYSGPLVVHCHVLYHEDLGMMTWFNTTGDDHTYNHRFENTGIFTRAPPHCRKRGQQCAPPYCTDYKYNSAARGAAGAKPPWWTR